MSGFDNSTFPANNLGVSEESLLALNSVLKEMYTRHGISSLFFDGVSVTLSQESTRAASTYVLIPMDVPTPNLDPNTKEPVMKGPRKSIPI